MINDSTQPPSARQTVDWSKVNSSDAQDDMSGEVSTPTPQGYRDLAPQIRNFRPGVRTGLWNEFLQSDAQGD